MLRLIGILAAAAIAGAASAESSVSSSVSLSGSGGTATVKINGVVVDSVSLPPGTRNVSVEAQSRTGQPPEVSIKHK